MADSDEYVTNHAWVRTVGRPDAIDEIADQFERHAATAPADVMTVAAAREREARWPQRSRGWRSIARLHPQTTSTSA